jgi:hypothetical protein
MVEMLIPNVSGMMKQTNGTDTAAFECLAKKAFVANVLSKKVAKKYSFDTQESKVAGSKDALMEAKAHLYKTEKKNMTVKEIAGKFKIHPREIVFVNDWSEFGIKLSQKSKFTLKGTEVWIPAQNYTRVECVQLEQLNSIAYLVCALNIHTSSPPSSSLEG